MLTTQRFTYTKDGKKKGFLLMPDEAQNIIEKLKDKTWEKYPLSFWFERFTGYSIEGIENLRLEVCHMDKPCQDLWS